MAGIPAAAAAPERGARRDWPAILVMLAIFLVAPFFVYPVFLMKALCFALFACAFNLLLGYAGLLSFGHAAFLATGFFATALRAGAAGFLAGLAAFFTGFLAATYEGSSLDFPVAGKARLYSPPHPGGQPCRTTGIMPG